MVLAELLLSIYAPRCLYLGIMIYFLGLLLPADQRTGYHRLLLQRVGAALVIEAFLLYLLRRMLVTSSFPPVLSVILLGILMLVGVPMLVRRQMQRVRVVEKPGGAVAVRPNQRPHWLLILVTAVLVMSLLGSAGYLLGALVGPMRRSCEGFCFSPVGEAIGLIGGLLLGLALVRRGVRQSS
jgi:hypothetical protein